MSDETQDDQLVQTEPQDQTVNPNEVVDTEVELDQPENDSEGAQDPETTQE